MSFRSDTDDGRGTSTGSETHMIVLPGGGYATHASHEAEPIAEWLEGLGLRASVFRYPLHARHPVPLEALRGEIRRRREGGADRIGIIGFSAGGHLAGLAALAPSTDESESVDFVVMAYAITSMETETYRPARIIPAGRARGAAAAPRDLPGRARHTVRAAILHLAHRRGHLRPSRAHLPPRPGARGQ